MLAAGWTWTARLTFTAGDHVITLDEADISASMEAELDRLDQETSAGRLSADLMAAAEDVAAGRLAGIRTRDDIRNRYGAHKQQTPRRTGRGIER